MEVKQIETYHFQHPFTCLIARPTKSGKTTLLEKILTNHEQMINKLIGLNFEEKKIYL